MTNTGNLLIRYGGAVVIVALAALIEVWFNAILGIGQPYLLLLGAVGTTGWFLGLGPSLLAVVLSVAVLGQTYDWDALQLAGEALFAIEGAGLAILVDSRQKERSRCREKEELVGKLLNKRELEPAEPKRGQAAEQLHSLWLEGTLSSIADGLVATDEAGVITFVNPVAQKILGVARNQIEGQPEQSMFQFVNEETKEPLISPIRIALGLERPPAKGDVQKTLLVTRSGNRIPVIANAAAIRESGGPPRGAVLVLHDLTLIQQSERWTAEIAQQYALLIDVVPVPIWTSDINSQRTYVNSKWLELTGRALEQTLGTGWAEALHPEDIDRYLSVYRTSFAARTRFEAEYRLLSMAGTYRWILERGVPRYNALGEFEGYIGSCVDITERKSEEEVVKRNEEYLRSVNAELERLNTELGVQNEKVQRAAERKMSFLAAMSHELRTPMNSILGFLQLLSEERGGPLTDKQKRYIDRIHSGGQHLLKVVEQVLDYSKIEAGRVQLDRQEFRARPVIEEIVAAVLQIDPGKHLTVTVEVDPNLIALADPHRFRQIFYNLLSNAFKFTPDLGRVTVSAVENGTMIKFSVTDTGPGIEPNQAAAIFEEFFQGDSPATNNMGTGLGLAITRRLVNAHGGSISVTTDVGKGSTFIFTLPAANSPEMLPHSVSPVSEIPPSS